jgi:hypothetical protein
MSYTAADIDEIVDDEFGPWSGNWDNFIGQAGATHEYAEVPEGTEGAFLSGGVFKAVVPKAVLGVTLPGIGHVTAVERDVRQNDEYFAILKVTDADGNERLFRRSGWYASHYGGEYDGPTFEVRPIEKLITVYNKVP